MIVAQHWDPELSNPYYADAQGNNGTEKDNFVGRNVYEILHAEVNNGIEQRRQKDVDDALESQAAKLWIPTTCSG